MIMVRLHSTHTFQHTQLVHKVFADRLADIKTLYFTLFFVYRQKLQKKATHSFVFMFISQQARLTTRLNTQTHTLTSSRQRFRQDVAHVYHIRQAFPNSRLLADIRSTSGPLWLSMLLPSLRFSHTDISHIPAPVTGGNAFAETANDRAVSQVWPSAEVNLSILERS